MRRLPARRVMQLSFAASVACVLIALWFAWNASWLIAAVVLALGVWFGVDGTRALRWVREEQNPPTS